MEPLLKDTPNKGHNKKFNLSVKDRFYNPYRTIFIFERGQPLCNSKIMLKKAGLQVFVI